MLRHHLNFFLVVFFVEACFCLHACLSLLHVVKGIALCCVVVCARAAVVCFLSFKALNVVDVKAVSYQVDLFALFWAAQACFVASPFEFLLNALCLDCNFLRWLH